ncbi:cache domain-containing sensor histidine kinase [Brevibacillus centrosporus]|uniref:cache domain-containing sensor histidine kinase n=1 Tax=Brevibacillus centrosporus TaxID=54910 RepID=UPI0037F6112C
MDLQEERSSVVPFVHSIFFKLFVYFLLLSIIPLTLSGLLTYKNVSELLVTKLDQDASSVLEQNSRTLAFYFNDLKRMGEISFLSSSVSDFLKNKDYDAYLLSFLPLDEAFSSIHLIRPENVGITLVSDHGFVYSYGYSLNRDQSSFYQFEWMPKLSQLSSEPTITRLHDRPYSTSQEEEPVFSYVQRLYSKDLKAKGILIIDFKRSILDSLFESSYFSKNAHGGIESGMLITSKSGDVLYPQDTDLFPAQDMQNLDQVKRITDRSGNLYRTVALLNEETDWTLIGYFRESTLYEPIYRIRNFTYWILLPSIVFCLLASFYLSHRMSDPIRHLQSLMIKVGQGDFHHLFTLRRKDEIGQLGRGFNQMVGKIKELIQLVHEEQSQKRRAELTALQSQIKPHFLYNTLESINSLARKHKEPQISKMIVLLGKLMRLSISTFDEMIPIWKELEYVRCYLELHQFRSRRPIEYEIEMDEEIQSLYTVKWVLQPVVENAILHGLDPIPKQDVSGRIEIKGWLEHDAVYLQVKDNGVGLEKSKLEEMCHNLEHHSQELTQFKQKVGLYNVQSRIRLHFGATYGLSVHSVPEQGMRVTIKLPRRTSDDQATDRG